MAKIKFDYTNVDESQSQYDGDEPTRGIYPAKVADIKSEQSQAGNPMLHVVYEITDGEYMGWRGHQYYVLTEEAAWKMKQFTDGVGLTTPGKKKGTIDTDTAVGKKCRIKTVREMYEGEPRGKVKSILSWKAEGDEDPGAEEEAPAEEEAVEDVAEEGSPEVWTWDDIKDMDRDELKKTIVEEELKDQVKVLVKDSDDDLRLKVAAALEIEVPAEDAEEPF